MDGVSEGQSENIESGKDIQVRGNCTCKGPEEWKFGGQETERSVGRDHNGWRGEKNIMSLERASGAIDLPGS